MKFAALQAKNTQPSSATSVPGAVPEWPATFYGPQSEAATPVEADAFRLEVTGLVANPLSLSLAELKALGDGVYEGRLVSVDGWSYASRWEGVLLKRLIEKAQPLPEARYLNQMDAHGRQEWLELGAVRDSNALLCFGERTGDQGQALSPRYGGPLWLMLYGSYSYKGLGQLARIEFARDPGPSLARARGYSEDGRIIPGDYYAFDQKIMRRVG